MHCEVRRAPKMAIAAGLIRKQEPVTIAAKENRVLELEGVIVEVDWKCREVQFEVDDRLLQFYVPPDCMILLNDERVKLRVLQAFDRARVVWSEEKDGAIAQSIAVRSDSSGKDTAGYKETAGYEEECVARDPTGLVEYA